MPRGAGTASRRFLGPCALSQLYLVGTGEPQEVWRPGRAVLGQAPAQGEALGAEALGLSPTSTHRSLSSARAVTVLH